MDQKELEMFAKNWARCHRNASETEQAKFASFVVETYPGGDRAMSWVWDYQPWKR